MQALKVELRRAESQNARPPKPLSVKTVKELIADMRGLLNQEIPAAAEAIRALTGPIAIRQESIPGRKIGAKWIATLSPTLRSWLRQRAKEKECPDSITLEFLNTRIWTIPGTLEIHIDHIPKYERIARQVQGLAAKGTSVNTIARATGVSFETIRDALRFSRTGQRPQAQKCSRKRSRKKGSQCPHRPPKKVLIAAEVAQLRDRQRWAFPKIAKIVGASESTVIHAYDLAHGDFTPAAFPESQPFSAHDKNRRVFGRLQGLGGASVTSTDGL